MLVERSSERGSRRDGKIEGEGKREEEFSLHPIGDCK